MVIYCLEFLTHLWYSWITMTPSKFPLLQTSYQSTITHFLIFSSIFNSYLFYSDWYLIWKLCIMHLTLTWYVLFEWADLDFLFHMFFLARYCKLLEENSFRGRTADFFYMLLFGASVLTGIVLLGGMIPYLSESFAKIIFLSNSLTFMMVSYICIHFLSLFSCSNLS